MLLRLTSGLFALAFALLLAQVPGFFAEKQNQLNQRDALLIDKIAVFSETAASTGMALPQFVQSLQSHNDDAIRAQGIEIARTLENQTRVKESLEAFSDTNVKTRFAPSVSPYFEQSAIGARSTVSVAEGPGKLFLWLVWIHCWHFLFLPPAFSRIEFEKAL